MSGAQTRRSLLRRTGLVILASLGLDGAAQSAFASVPQSSRGYRSTAVDAVRGQQVTVVGSHDWIPLECVPAGWQPMIGDAVAVGPSPLLGETSAQQIVRWMTRPVAPSDLVPGRRIGRTNGPVITELSTIDPSLASFRNSKGTRPKFVRIAVATRFRPDGRERVLSVHPER
jgi:hypothetical protein